MLPFPDPVYIPFYYLTGVHFQQGSGMMPLWVKVYQLKQKQE